MSSKRIRSSTSPAGKTQKKRRAAKVPIENEDEEASCSATEEEDNNETLASTPKRNNHHQQNHHQLMRTMSVPPCAEGSKVFNDPVHGYLDMHPVVVRIIDTPQFQRLRYLRQLGVTYLVFPSAGHSRFEHSLGVCHLAGSLARLLQKLHPEYEITDVDVLCVEIAGLCHDLGHGPFSHVFDGVFVPMRIPGTTWTHEQASVNMFDHLIAVNHLRDELRDGRLRLDDRDLLFIKEMMDPPKGIDKGEWPCKGRKADKSFLYQIVANKVNGIDVDKWDYFARDAFYLGIKHCFDHRRLIKFVRVLRVGDRLEICYREKVIEALYGMFNTREQLHRMAYQHPVGNCIAIMICEALCEVDKALEANLALPTEQQDVGLIALFGKITLADAIHDMERYTELTDSIFELILYADHPALTEARAILSQVQRREHWKVAGSVCTPKDVDMGMMKKIKHNDLEVRQALVQAGRNHDFQQYALTPEDICFNVVQFNYGSGNKDPMARVHFWRKDAHNEPFSIGAKQVSNMLPAQFNDHTITMYCKIRNVVALDYAKSCFIQWCKDTGLQEVRGGHEFQLHKTPLKMIGDTEASTQAGVGGQPGAVRPGHKRLFDCNENTAYSKSPK